MKKYPGKIGGGHAFFYENSFYPSWLARMKPQIFRRPGFVTCVNLQAYPRISAGKTILFAVKFEMQDYKVNFNIQPNQIR